MRAEPYLNFDGKSDEAIEFYKKTLGAKVAMLIRFKEMPEPHPTGSCPPEIAEKVMHARITVGDSVILLSDGRCTGKSNFSGFSISLTVDSDDEAKSKFQALAEGGKITMPMDKTFFASSFGMVTDKFGLHWMVIKQQ